MADAPSPAPDGKTRRHLPPELEFLRQPPPPDLEAEELIAHIREQHARIRQHADLIRAHGMDPDTLIAFTEQAVLKLEQACQKCDATDEQLFHAMADNADAQHDLFKTTKSLIEPLYAERPFDEEVQEMKEFLDEWSKQMPKE